MPYKDKEKQKAAQLLWLRKRRNDWLSKNGPCKMCGSTEKLEIHHRDPSEKTHHAVWSWSPVRRSLELEKCDVLCWECHHKIVHHVPITHGKSGYKRGCRCEICRSGNRGSVYARRLAQWGSISSKPKKSALPLPLVSALSE